MYVILIWKIPIEAEEMLTLINPVAVSRLTEDIVIEKLDRDVDVLSPEIITAWRYEEEAPFAGHPLMNPCAKVDWRPDTPKFWLMSNRSAVNEPAHKSLREFTK